MKKTSRLEAVFAMAASECGLEIDEREFQFLRDRKFRFDFAWPRELVAVEIEGGIWNRGGHTRGKGYRANCEKYNLAAAAGWSVLRYTTNDLRENPFQCISQVAEVLLLKKSYARRWSRKK